MDLEPIGMVLGTEDATPLQFWFGVTDGAKVQLDDIVTVTVQDPAQQGEDVTFYGVVDEVRKRLEGVQFDSDTVMVVDGLMPANVTYAAHVLVTRVEPEDFIPPGPGDSVYLAQGTALEKALYLDNMDLPLPCGVLRNGEPGYLNFDFISGQKGAHINISGISGIATKTSYALFLLYSIFNARHRKTGGRLLGGAANAKALIFNVKGEDLLFLDKQNRRFHDEEDKWRQKRKSDKDRFGICDLPAKAFCSVSCHAPAMDGPNVMADVRSRDNVQPYLWTLHDFAKGRMLPFVFSDRDSMSNLGFLMSHLEEKLYRLAESQRGPGLEVPLFSHVMDGIAIKPFAENEDLSSNEFLNPERQRELRGDTERLKTFDDLVGFLQFKLLDEGASDDEGRGGGDRAWTANQARATREAFIRRLRGAAKHVRRLVRGDLSQKEVSRSRLNILDSGSQVNVIDIHQLAPLAQMFVVGVLLKQVFDDAEERAGKQQVFIVLDELNKYAPAEGDSPIKDVLLDIAERGRSLGIILIGAQQTASEVERRVVANAAVRIVGRLDAAEAERSEYRFMPGTFRLRATILAPGTMIVHQPDVPSPMMLTFPFPAWATRAKEVLGDVSDEAALDVLG